MIKVAPSEEALLLAMYKLCRGQTGVTVKEQDIFDLVEREGLHLMTPDELEAWRTKMLDDIHGARS